MEVAVVMCDNQDGFAAAINSGVMTMWLIDDGIFRRLMGETPQRFLRISA